MFIGNWHPTNLPLPQASEAYRFKIVADLLLSPDSTFKRVFETDMSQVSSSYVAEDISWNE